MSFILSLKLTEIHRVHFKFDISIRMCIYNRQSRKDTMSRYHKRGNQSLVD